MPHGKICYLEIPAKTAKASAEFYSSFFGWGDGPGMGAFAAFTDRVGNEFGLYEEPRR